jgi:hypothetical protein
VSITLDTATQGNTLSFSHTVGALANRYLIVQVNIGSATVSVSGVTYDGAPLTRLIRNVASGNGVEFWGLVNPAIGANTVAITLSGAAGTAQAAISCGSSDETLDVALAGVPANGVSATASAAIQASSGDLLVLGLVSGDGGALPTAPATSLWNDHAGDEACSVAANGSLQTIAFTMSGSTTWGVALVAVHATAPTNTVASLAVQRAVYAALSGHLTDPVTSAGVGVYDQVPDNTAFPYVQMCAAAETASNTFGRTGRSVLYQVDVWTRSGADATADGWYQAKNIAGQIDALLDGATPSTSDGWATIIIQFESSKENELADGITRRVMMEYRAILETA